ncbi:hypothetical protein GRI38_10850 [Altererythrobacter aurantiacus]|uniref:Uncharacterized protein n=1 Tax=Parapontixanthobacter aurantiacus TaxID=1463599 RepID=A0A844ZGM3_9SPHN|nr:hypothetical protein [Parapontixanthobacter aurantiacus]
MLAPALNRFKGALGHGSSPSIPSIVAKPFLDLLVGAPEPLAMATIRTVLEEVGYKHAIRAGAPEHELFDKGEPLTGHPCKGRLIERGGEAPPSRPNQSFALMPAV